MSGTHYRDSDFIGYNSKASEQPADSERKYNIQQQSPKQIPRVVEGSKYTSPVEMSQSYFQDSDTKSLSGQSNQRISIAQRLGHNQGQDKQTSSLMTFGGNASLRAVSSDWRHKEGVSNLNSSHNNINSHKVMTIQEMNTSQTQESFRSKKMTELENSVMREKIYFQTLNAEKDSSAHNKLKDSDKEEVSRLYILCKEKDQIIASLMDDLAAKPSREAADAERIYLQSQINNYQNANLELEKKIVAVTIENDRLNRKIQDREFQMQKKSSENAFNEDKFKIEMEELIQNYEERLNKLIMENDKIVMINENLRNKLDQLQNNFENREKQLDEQADNIRAYWKEHFQKEWQEHKITIEMEKEVQENQLKHSKQINFDTDQKMKALLSEIQELSAAIIEKDSLLQEFQVQLGVFDKKQQEFSEINYLYFEGSKKNKELENKLNVILTENAKLAGIADSIRLEQESWKQRYLESEERCSKSQVEFSKQVQELKFIHEEQKDNFLRSEKANLEYQARREEEDKMNLLIRIVLVQAENEKSHTQIIQLQRTIDDYQFQIKQHNQKYLLYEADQTVLTERNEDLQKKIESLIHNIDELNKGLQIRIEEVEIWRKKYEELEQEFEIQMESTSFSHEKQMKEQKLKSAMEFENLRQDFDEKIKRQKLTSASEIAQLEKKLEDKIHSEKYLENRIETLRLEIDSHSTLLLEQNRKNDHLQLMVHEIRLERDQVQKDCKEKESEYEILRNMFERMEQQHNFEFDEYISKLRCKDEEVEDAKKERQNKNIEIDSLKSKMMLIDEEIEKRKAVYNDLQIKFNQIIDENERLLNKANESDILRRDIDNLKIKQMEDIEYIKYQVHQEREKELSEQQLDFRQRLTKEVTDQRQYYDSIVFKLENSINAYENQLKRITSDFNNSEVKWNQQQEQFNQKIKEIEQHHKMNLDDQHHRQQREFEIQFKNHSNQLKSVISDHEREITSLKCQVENLTTELNVEKSKAHRTLIDLDKACRDIDIWRSKAGHIDPNHPYIVEIQSQLEIKRRENLELQSRLHEADRIKNDLERVVSRTRLRAPSADSFRKLPGIALERSTINLEIIEENDKLNRMVLNRCREIVQNKH